MVLVPCSYDDPADDWQYIDDSYPEGYNPPPEGYPDHGDLIWWELLQLDLGSNDFEYPERVEGVQMHSNYVNEAHND